MVNPDTTLCFDGHVHLYPAHSLDTALDRLIGNLGRMAAASAPADAPSCRIALLAEGRGWRFFPNLSEGRLRPQASSLVARRSPEDGALEFVLGGDILLYMLAGRQIVTAERIEILALAADIREDLDGMPAPATAAAIRAAGGIPVVSWAPGKWFFGRGTVVRNLVDRSRPGEMLVGDTSLRPPAWPEPALMQRARNRGFAIIAGSDPLPFAGEEEIMGTYGFVCRAAFDASRPVTSVRNLLTAQPAMHRLAGRRSGAADVLRRLLKNRAARKSMSNAPAAPR